jgi:putative hemolysin
MRIRIQRAAGLAMGVLLCGLFLAASAAAQTPNAAADASAAVNERAAYCTKTGGAVEYRKPYYNTNSDPSQWLVLAGGEGFCQYTRGTGDTSSRIHVSLNTLTAKEPSLAALAYYAEVPYVSQGGGGNPASYYCTQLGGSDSFGGVNPFGGGWVKFDAIDEVLEACIFPDNSTIDSWGLLYHSAGIIRGRNLAHVLKFKNPYATSAAKPN